MIPKKVILSLVLLLQFLISHTLQAQPYAPLSKIQASMEMDNIGVSFLNMNQYFRSKPLHKATTPFYFPEQKSIELPTQFSYEGVPFRTQQFIDSSYTQGLLVIQDGAIVFENYYRGQDAATQHISWSMAKSYISALFGIAMEEGYIKDLNETVDQYLPMMKGSGYEGVKIKDVLEMSTGIGFDETYSNPESDISRWWLSFSLGESQDEFAASLKNDHPAGTYNKYVSINTHVLGMILTKATGKSITDYMQEKLWTPLGSEYDAYWLSDKLGMEMALGGLNACLRDYAKLGQLFLDKGKWQGKQLIPASWITDSTTPSSSHLQPQSKQSSSRGIGYAYQWWIPDGKEGEFLAIGVFNQYIYVNPSTRTVIVKNSANKNYYDNGNPFTSTAVHVELFRKIAHRK